MALALMCALPFALAWWIVPAIPLARERFETYALLTVSGPVSVLVLCPALALAAGETGAVIGFAAGWAVGGLINGLWAVRYARLPEARDGPEHGVREAGGFGARAWVNDLFQLINLRPDLFILSAYYGTADTGVYAVTVSITSLVWIVSQPLASVVLPRNAMVFASSDPGLTPVIPGGQAGGRGAALRADLGRRGPARDPGPGDRAARLGARIRSHSGARIDSAARAWPCLGWGG